MAEDKGQITKTRQRLKVNLVVNKGSKVVIENIDGVDYYKLPTIIMVEGVHTGNMGPVLYKGKEMAKWVKSWDSKPAVYAHPQKGKKFVSAASKEIIEKKKLGFMLNTSYDKKTAELKTDSMLDVAKVKKIAPELEEKILNGGKIEVSIGLDMGLELGTGVFNSKRYIAEACDFRPDHLAFLPEGEEGACSCASGCGVVNSKVKIMDPFKLCDVFITNLAGKELSFTEITERLSVAIKTRFGKPGVSWYGYPIAVYSDSLIYYDESSIGSYYKIGYSVKGDEVTIDSGTPDKVVRRVSFETVDGKGVYVTNSAGELSLKTPTETVMSKKVIDGLIANGSYTEDEREFLESLDEKGLGILTSKIAKPKKKVEEEKVVNKAGETKDEDVVVISKAEWAQSQKLLKQASSLYERQQASFVATILNSKGNEFTEDELTDFSIESLEKMAKMSTPAESEDEEEEVDVVVNKNPYKAFGKGAGGKDKKVVQPAKKNDIKDGEGLDNYDEYEIPGTTKSKA